MTMTIVPDVPDERGYFGAYGGRFVPETIIPALDELTEAYGEFRHDAAFQAELAYLHATYTGRPTPISYAQRLTEYLGGARDLTEIDLSRAYKSTVDPRLNYEQSLELAMLIVRKRGSLTTPD